MVKPTRNAKRLSLTACRHHEGQLVSTWGDKAALTIDWHVVIAGLPPCIPSWHSVLWCRLHEDGLCRLDNGHRAGGFSPTRSLRPGDAQVPGTTR